MLFPELKVGDVVAVERGRYGIDRATVTRVAPTMFDVGSATYYRKDGSQRGGNWHLSSRAYPLTDERIAAKLAKIDHAKRVEFAANALRSASPDLQAQVCALLGV